MIRYLSVILGITFLSAIPPSYAIYTAFPEDVEESRRTPLIASQIIEAKATQSIIDGTHAAITICTTPLGPSWCSYNHVALVFEMLHPQKEDELLLRTVHLGGDGYSSIQPGRPIIDDTSETLKKMYRGQQITDNARSIQNVLPIYSSHFVFLAPIEAAKTAFADVEQDSGLKYSLFGRGFSYNCCTYAHRVLKNAGIDIGFERYHFKRWTNFSQCCDTYRLQEGQDLVRSRSIDLPQKKTKKKDDSSLMDRIKDGFSVFSRTWGSSLEGIPVSLEASLGSVEFFLYFQKERYSDDGH